YLAAALPAAALALDGGLFSDTRIVQQPGLLRFPVTATEGASIIGKFSKRQTEISSFAARSGTLYTVNINIGTPGQTVPVQFDTGSSELWVNPTCSKSSTPAFCDAQPQLTGSSSLVDTGAAGSVTYGTGYADFNYVVDYVRLGAATITQQIFGVAYDSAHAVVGIMGAGPDLGGWTSSPYPLVIDSLASQQLINSRAFSMDLRGFTSDQGSVIFGGVDTKKYEEDLFSLPVVPAAQSPDGYTRWWVNLAGIKVNQADGTVVPVYTPPSGGSGQPVLLDSGYTLSALPTAIFDNLVAAFPSAVYVPSADLYVVDCLDPGQGGSVDFVFGDDSSDKTIRVPYNDFVWHVPDSSLCVLGAFEDDFPVLGDTFLRSAYVVYDWDNKKVHIAQSANCGTNLIAIGPASEGVPQEPGCPKVTPEPPVSSSSVISSSMPVSSSVASSSAPASSSVASSSLPASSSAVVSSSSYPSSSAPISSIPSSSGYLPSSITPSASLPVDTITFTCTDIYTITSCPPHVTNCHAGAVTTHIVPVTTTVCPQTTATYAIPQKYVCPATGGHGCKPGETITRTVPLTLKPYVP
ncbi:aspartic peptidase domain-containing protein, partial [Cercophora newfieldiana]